MSNWHWESSTQALDFGKLNQRMKALENAFNADLGALGTSRTPVPTFRPETFGGRAGIVDNTTALQRTFDAAKDAGGARVHIEGEYRYDGELDIEDALNITIGGAGTAAHSESRLVYTGDGDRGISLASSQGIKFEHIFLAYDNEDFEGSLVDTGHSAALSDPAHLVFEDTRFAGLSPAIDAASLVRLDKVIFASFRGCAFWNAVRAVMREGGYANGVSFTDQCVFVNLGAPPILNPSEAWSVTECGFQQLSTNQPGSVECNDGQYWSGGVYAGNWHGDATVGGAPWVTAQCLGVTFTGNTFTGPAATADEDNAISLLTSQGVVIAGNRFSTYNGIRLLAAQNGLTVTGNDFGGAGTGVLGLAANAPFGWVTANENFADFIAQSAAFTAPDGATVDATYGAEEAGVINNHSTRLAEIEAILEKIGAAAT